MPNLQNLFILRNNSGTLVNAIGVVDLDSTNGTVEVNNTIKPVWITLVGASYQESNSYQNGSIYATKIINPYTGQYTYVAESFSNVSKLIKVICAACEDVTTTTTTTTTSASKDYEPIILCDTLTGNPVIVTYTFDENGVLTISNTNVDGSAFTGTVTKCESKNYAIGTKTWVCVNAVDSVSREEIINLDNSSNVATIWRDIAGTIISAPAIGTYTVGVCDVNGTTKDYEYIPNIASGFYDLHIFTTANGVANPTPTIVATTIPIAQAPLSFQTNSYCNRVTNTTWFRTIGIDSAGAEAIISDVDSGIACYVESPQIVDNDVEFWVRLDANTPSQSIDVTDLESKKFNSLNVLNMSGFSKGGDFTPFLNQDPTNTTVVWIEVSFNGVGGVYKAQFAIPPGGKLIQKEDATIEAVNFIAVCDHMDEDLINSANKIKVVGLQASGTPSTPINLLFTFSNSTRY